MSRSFSIPVMFAVVGLAGACGSSRMIAFVGSDCDGGFCDPSSFTSYPDATLVSDAAPDADAGPALCPTTDCVESFATCNGSVFPCDVNLGTNPNHCGACGAACPALPESVKGRVSCEEGQCILACNPGTGDCDGIRDNGCETVITTTDNCGACGNKCAGQDPCIDGTCGCPPPTQNCDGACVNVMNNDSACGSCSNACEAEPPGWTPLPEAYNGCVGVSCNRKCRAPFANCNGDWGDGCEIDLGSPNNDHCGGCGIKCENGTTCRSDDATGSFRCACPSHLTDCSLQPDRLRCIDLMTNPGNCGGCGLLCGPSQECRDGRCQAYCPPNWADCNGFAGDGCERNLLSDPNHCGRCGNECDDIAGQPCVDGRCAVDECRGPGAPK